MVDSSTSVDDLAFKRSAQFWAPRLVECVGCNREVQAFFRGQYVKGRPLFEIDSAHNCEGRRRIRSEWRAVCHLKFP